MELKNHLENSDIEDTHLYLNLRDAFNSLIFFFHSSDAIFFSSFGLLFIV